MALTKEIVVDKIEVVENGCVQVRTATRIVEDGNVISSSCTSSCARSTGAATLENRGVIGNRYKKHGFFAF